MRFEDRDEWEMAVDEVSLQAWREAGRENELTKPAWVTMAGVLDEPEPSEAEEFESWKKFRVIVVAQMMNFLWADGPHPMKALKRLFAITRRISPQHLCSMTLDQVAILLNETKQATQTREERVVEDLLKGLGFKSTKAPRGKSAEARANYSHQRKGSQSRLGGKKAVRKYSALRHQNRKENLIKEADQRAKKAAKDQSTRVD